MIRKCFPWGAVVPFEKLRVCAEITWENGVSRRPTGKAQNHRNMDIFRGFATPAGGMHRRPKWKVISAQALRTRDGVAPIWGKATVTVSILLSENRE